MLDGQRDVVAIAAQIEIAVAPGMELGRAAQRLPGADAAAALLGVVDDEDGNAVAALQLAQIGQQWGDLAAGVLVDAMQAHERIEDEQARLQSGDGLGEVAAVGIEVEPNGRRGDDLDIEVGQLHAGGDRDAFEAAAHDMQGILGRKEQDPAGARHREPAQARHTRCDGNREIER